MNLQCIYDLVQAVGRVSQELQGEVVNRYSPDEQVERPPSRSLTCPQPVAAGAGGMESGVS